MNYLSKFDERIESKLDTQRPDFNVYGKYEKKKKKKID